MIILSFDFDSSHKTLLSFLHVIQFLSNKKLLLFFIDHPVKKVVFIYRSPCRGGSVGGGGLPYQRPNVVETKYIVKKNGPMGTSNQANAAASFFAKAHQKLQLNNNGLHDLSLRNNGGQGCSPASSRRFQVSSIMTFSTRVLHTKIRIRGKGFFLL